MTSRYQVYSTNLNDGTELIWKTEESIHISDSPLSISQNDEGVEGQREVHSIIDIKGTTDKHSAAGVYESLFCMRFSRIMRMLSCQTKWNQVSGNSN